MNSILLGVVGGTVHSRSKFLINSSSYSIVLVCSTNHAISAKWYYYPKFMIESSCGPFFFHLAI